MSTISDGAPDFDVGLDGIRRYKTTCKVLVHGYVHDDAIVLSEDVLTIQMGKTVKGAGQANITLTASRNYLNLLFPNDYINIYIDLGNKNGFVRTFFGFIDRIEEDYRVIADGKPTTTYRLLCTDFYKAFDKSEIYFNPQLAARSDIEGIEFGAPNVGGLAMLMRGLAMTGTPTFILQHFILLTMGFGSQFSLPTSYENALVDTSIRSRLIRERIEFVSGLLGTEAKKRLKVANNDFATLKQQLSSAIDSVLITSTSGTVLNVNIPAIANIAQITEKEVADKLLDLSDPTNMASARDTFFSIAVQNMFSAKHGLGTPGSSTIHILNSTLDGAKPSLLEILDIFSFVETRATDGYVAGLPVWQSQGSLISIMRSFSHEHINEMIIDLRPMLDKQGDFNQSQIGNSGNWWSREADEIGGNIGSDVGSANGIQMLPAIVVREYPFSTIQNIDGRNVSLSLQGDDGTAEKAGVMHFGAIFSSGIGVPGRQVVDVPNLSLEDSVKVSAPSSGQKHLDVAVISKEEIIQTKLGRSDHDHFNLFELWSDSVLGKDQRWYMHDVLPIITPIQIMRHGLRPRKVTTRFARFSVEGVSRFERQVTVPSDKPAEDKKKITEVVAAPGVGILPEDPDDVDWPTNQGRNWGAIKKMAEAYGVGINVYLLARTMASELRFTSIDQPIDPAHLVAPWAAVNMSRTAYRRITTRRGSDRQWLFPKDRNGNKKASTTNVGWALLGRRGRLGGHGDVRGKVDPDGKLKAKKGENGGIRPQATSVFPGDIEHQAVQDTRVNGTKTQRNTGFATQRRARRLKKDDKLELEISATDMAMAEKYFAVAKGILAGDPAYPDPGQTNDIEGSPGTVAGGTVTFQHGPPSTAEIVGRSAVDQHLYILDPPAGSTTTTWGFGRSVITPELIRLGDLSQGISAPEVAVEVPRLANAVDTQTSRSQILRWALLQDHWYQHNLEYISGTITMRGAPDIRVGYRLDIKESNLSFYVEGVNHAWKYPGSMSTTLTVTRGQPNNPNPVYVFPKLETFGPTDSQRRRNTSRLATYFLTPDPVAVRRALVLGGAESGRPDRTVRNTHTVNVVDSDNLGAYQEKLLSANAGEVDDITPVELKLDPPTRKSTGSTDGVSGANIIEE